MPPYHRVNSLLRSRPSLQASLSLSHPPAAPSIITPYLPLQASLSLPPLPSPPPRDRVNGALAADQPVGSLLEELKKMDKENRAEPLNFTHIVVK